MFGIIKFIKLRFYNYSLFLTGLLALTNAAVRQKRQEDEGEEGNEDQTVDELCKDRPPDEYFRLTTTGDCRDVVR